MTHSLNPTPPRTIPLPRPTSPIHTSSLISHTHLRHPGPLERVDEATLADVGKPDNADRNSGLDARVAAVVLEQLDQGVSAQAAGALQSLDISVDMRYGPIESECRRTGSC